jgi:hypothetical protein
MPTFKVGMAFCSSSTTICTSDKFGDQDTSPSPNIPDLLPAEQLWLAPPVAQQITSDAHPDVLVSRDRPDSSDEGKVRQLHKSERTDQTCKPS